MNLTSHEFSRFTALFLVATGLGIPIAGCTKTPRADEEASRFISDAEPAAGMIVFRVVGDEAGLVDEVGSTGPTLTLRDAVRSAVSTDPGLQAALARIRVAMADADQARLLPNPVFNLILRWSPGSSMVEVSLTQDFIQALQIPKRTSAADNRLRQTTAEAVTVAIDVAAEVRERYAAIQAVDKLVPVLNERLALIEKLATAARARLEAREGTQADVATIEAQRAELRLEIDTARRHGREERIRLARLIGQPSSASNWALEAWVAPTVAARPESAWIDLALTNRPEIRAIAWQLRALDDDAALARLLPWEGASIGVEAEHETEWAIGPSLSTPIPIFDMGQARSARVTAEQQEARYTLVLTRRKIVEEVRLALEGLNARRANLAWVRDELLPIQRRRRQLADDAYRAGLTDVTALYLAEHDLRSSEAKAVEIEEQLAIAMVRLERAVGGAGVANTTLAPAATTSPAAATQPAPTQH